MAPGRFRFRPTWPRMVGASVLAAAALALLWQGLLLAVSLVFPETAVAGYGTLAIGQEAPAVLLRREILLTAPCDGVFRRSHPAGERIARSGVVGTIETGGRKSRPLRAPRAGLIAYTCDGRDGGQAPLPAGPAIAADPRAAYQAAEKRRPRPAGQGRVRRGEPLARLVDDEEQYLVARLRGIDRPLPAGKTVWARLAGELLPLAVTGTVGEGGTTWTALRTERFPRAWLDRRRIQVHLVLDRYTGTLVPARYLRRRGGTLGVIAMTRGRPEFKAVQVLGRDRDWAVVEGLAEGTVLLPR